jgi:hypothetical protein
MWNAQPVMERSMPPEQEHRHCRRPTAQEMASGRAYMDPRARASIVYVAGAVGVDGDSRRRPALEDARVDSRTYLSRHGRSRRV